MDRRAYLTYDSSSLDAALIGGEFWIVFLPLVKYQANPPVVVRVAIESYNDESGQHGSLSLSFPSSTARGRVDLQFQFLMLMSWMEDVRRAIRPSGRRLCSIEPLLLLLEKSIERCTKGLEDRGGGDAF